MARACPAGTVFNRRLEQCVSVRGELFGNAQETRIGGYPKRDPAVPGGVSGAWMLTDWKGNILGRGSLVNCSKIRPGTRGSWISSERCSYRFKVDGQWYACRGYGEGIAASCRVMKPASVKRARLAGTRRGRRP